MSERKVNWAIVGIGDIVRKRVGPAMTAQPNSTLRACVTRDPAARRDDLKALGVETVYEDFGAMLSDKNVDAVYLATPTFLHAPHAIAAMEAGKDVLVEKPMALNASEAADMRRVAQRTGRRLAVAYYRRFWPSFQAVKDFCESGELGQIVLARIVLHSWYRPEANAPGAWRVRSELSGGGVLADVGCHRLDLLTWWLGLPDRVAATVQTQTQPYTADDAVAAVMLLSNGAHCTVSLNWNSKTFADEIHVIGTEGAVSLVPCDGTELIVTSGKNVERRTVEKPQNLHYPLIDDFSLAIVENRPPRFSAAEGMAATRVMDAIYQASRTSSWTKLD